MNSQRNLPSSMPCPNCRRLISTRSGRCIHCGYRLPGATLKIPFLSELVNQRVHLVDPIIIACFILYAISIGLDFPGAFQRGSIFNLFAPSDQALLKLGMGGYIPIVQGGRWWTALTATYLHGSILHILFNMLWLRQLGTLVEELFGASRFLLIYTISGVSGALLSALVFRTPYFVGASGAVFGLFGALLVYGFRRGGTFGSAIFRQMLIWSLIGLAFGFLQPRVDNWGHIGGIIAGALTAMVIGYQEQSRQKLSHHFAALIVLAFIIICFAMIALSFFL